MMNLPERLAETGHVDFKIFITYDRELSRNNYTFKVYYFTNSLIIFISQNTRTFEILIKQFSGIIT